MECSGRIAVGRRPACRTGRPGDEVCALARRVAGTAERGRRCRPGQLLARHPPGLEPEPTPPGCPRWACTVWVRTLVGVGPGPAGPAKLVLIQGGTGGIGNPRHPGSAAALAPGWPPARPGKRPERLAPAAASSAPSWPSNYHDKEHRRPAARGPATAGAPTSSWTTWAPPRWRDNIDRLAPGGPVGDHRHAGAAPKTQIDLSRLLRKRGPAWPATNLRGPAGGRARTARPPIVAEVRGWTVAADRGRPG